MSEAQTAPSTEENRTERATVTSDVSLKALTERPEWIAPAERESLALDQAFDVLRNERRRLALKYLSERDGSVTLSELAESIAAHQTGKSVQQLSSSERKCVYVGLYQCHLPRMDSMGVVDFNKPRGIIAPAKNTALVQYYLRLSEHDHSHPWPLHYLALSGVGLLLFLAGLSIGGVVPHLVFFVGMLACTVSALGFGREQSKIPAYPN